MCFFFLLRGSGLKSWGSLLRRFERRQTRLGGLWATHAIEGSNRGTTAETKVTPGQYNKQVKCDKKSTPKSFPRGALGVITCVWLRSWNLELGA